MCDWHHSQWRNLYHGYLKQHAQMAWWYQQQYPYVNAIASHFANNSQCNCSAHVPPALCANESPCCSAPTWPVRTCYIYANKSPHCCTDHPLPVNTECTSQSCYYPKRYPLMIDPHVLKEYTHGFKNAEKSESSSEDEDDEDSSNEDSFDDSSDENEDESDNSSIGIQYSRKKDNESSIVRNPRKLEERCTEEDDSPRFSREELQNFAYWDQVLAKKRAEIMAEDDKEEFSFKIIEEPCETIRFDESDEDDSYDEDEDDEDSSDEDEDGSDTKSVEGTEPPRYGVHLELDAYGQLQQRVGRMTPTALEDNLFEQKLGECVYGAKAEAICGQETLMITKFNRLFDMTLPKLRPVLPISP